MRRPLAFVAAVLLGVPAVAGCGSSSSSGSTASSGAASTTSAASASSPAAGSGKTVQVVYQNTAINPANITVKVGTTVKWVNKDSVIHNVTSTGGPAHLASSNLSQGGTYQFTATAPGVIHYVCTIHPTTMIGTITVTK